MSNCKRLKRDGGTDTGCLALFMALFIRGPEDAEVEFKQDSQGYQPTDPGQY